MKLQTFTVSTFNCHTAQAMDNTVSAHFLTADGLKVRFWTKPRWYSRRRCVGVFDWRLVVGVRNEVNADWLKEAGVKL